MALIRKHTCVLVLCLFSLVSSISDRQSESAKKELEDYIERERLNVNPRYRPFYHIAGPVGWINDPNGFSFYKGEYHLFYQFYPYDSVWGPMHWGHVSSPDLVTWKQLPTALLPEEEMCFSGSAVEDGDRLVLMYTAHIVSETEPRVNESQYLAFSEDGVNFYKYEGNPVISSAPNLSPDFRDPKVWKYGDHWYTIIGSKTDDDRGKVFLYRSTDMITWDFLNILAESDGSRSLGYMWECPDFFELDGKYILLISPQGMDPQGDRYKNIHQTGYFIGTFSYDTFEFIPEVGFQEIDYGHDFYAAQTTEANGRRYLSSWFNTWEKEIPETEDGWSGILTIVRELRLRGDKIYQTPVEAMVSLRESGQFISDFEKDYSRNFSKSTELILRFDLAQNIEILLTGVEGGDKVTLKWDSEVEKVIVDRDGDDRQVEWRPTGSRSWRIFLDASSLELFCGDGEVVFSSRVYPEGEWLVTNSGSQKFSLESYTLKRSVPDSTAPPSDSSSSSLVPSMLKFVAPIIVMTLRASLASA